MLIVKPCYSVVILTCFTMIHISHYSCYKKKSLPSFMICSIFSSGYFRQTNNASCNKSSAKSVLHIFFAILYSLSYSRCVNFTSQEYEISKHFTLFFLKRYKQHYVSFFTKSLYFAISCWRS